jgi:hypothetical protein
MKRFTAAAIFLTLTLTVMGCNTFPWSRNTASTGVNTESNAVFVKREPQAQELVAYLNDNARRVQAVQALTVTMDCRQGNETPIGLDAKIACSRPKNFRLQGTVAGQPQVDIGSNDDEFWYWIGKADPHVFHCSYKDMSTGQVRLPFPFNPDMVVCALNMAEYNPNARYEVRVNNRENVVELIEPMKSMQGQDVFKVTYFNRGDVNANRPRVFAYALKDTKGKDICTASMLEMQTNKETGAVLPVRVKIVFYGEKPADRGEMTLRFYDLKPTTFDAERLALMFSRKGLSHLQGYDLARGAPDQPSGTSMSIQRVGVPTR